MHSSQKYVRDNCTVMHTLNYKAYVTVVQINTHDAETVKQLKKKKRNLSMTCNVSFLGSCKAIIT